jgi:hypothetical protein
LAVRAYLRTETAGGVFAFAPKTLKKKTPTLRMSWVGGTRVVLV